MNSITSLDWALANAVDFARPLHEAVNPGYFDEHVIPVLEECKKHTQDPAVLVATVLHDVIEDTSATYQDVLGIFGFTIAFYVDNVTDAEGYTNRQSRKQHSYHKIRRHQNSVLIKLCDRKQNLQRCLEVGESARFGDMYLKEEYTFKAALWIPKKWELLWSDIDDLIVQIKQRNLVNGKKSS